MVKNETDLKIKCLRSDNGGEFTSKFFQQYCDENGIKRQFSTTRTPQQNGVAERKNRTMQEMGRTMLKDSKLDEKFWVQAIDTTFFIINIIILRNNCNKTPYELCKGKPTNVKYFRIFRSKCYIKREDQKLCKFESRVDEGIFVGYSCKIKAYKCYNLRQKQIVESINVTFDKESVLTNNDEDLESLKLETEAEKGIEKILEQEATVNQEELNNNQQDIQEQQQEVPPKRTKEWIQKNHPSNQIIGDINEGIGTRKGRHLRSSQQAHITFITTFEPSSFEEAGENLHWVAAMNEELDQIEKNNTWELVPQPKDKNVIGTKWVFRKKLNEDGHVTRNKERLV